MKLRSALVLVIFASWLSVNFTWGILPTTAQTTGGQGTVPGQRTMAASQSVTIASDQSAVAVTIGGSTGNLSVNLAQVAGATVNTGAGSSTGSQRVAANVYYADGTAIASTDVASVTGTGTAGSAASGVVTIQGIASGTVVPGNITQIGSTATLVCATAGCFVVAGGVVSPVTPTGLTSGTYRQLMIDPNGGARTSVSNAGYLSVVSATSSVINGASGPTDVALVTATATQRIIVHELTVKCGSTVTNAITLTVGLGAATIPASGAGLIDTITTGASAFQGVQRGSGFPNILAVGAAGEDLRVTSTNPSAGSCPVSYVYSIEGV